MTRVTTLMMGRETSARSYPEIGVPDAHHPLSHHQGDSAKNDKLAKINLFHMTLFAEYVEKLKRTQDGEGTLLDGTMLLYGGGMSDGDAHSHDNLPVLLLGGGAGTLRVHAVDGKPVHAKGRMEVAPGARITVTEAGGGGFGDPRQRDRASIASDVADGFVSPDAARTIYGAES